MHSRAEHDGANGGQGARELGHEVRGVQHRKKLDAANSINIDKAYASGNSAVANYSHPSGCAYTVIAGNVTFQKALNLAPWYYVFQRKFTVDPDNAAPTTINGTGVTLIFIGQDNNDLSTAGKGTRNISAPTSGPTAGIAIWILGASPSTSANLNASSDSKFTGAVYALQVDLTMNGGSSTTSLPGGCCTQIIAAR